MFSVDLFSLPSTCANPDVGWDQRCNSIQKAIHSIIKQESKRRDAEAIMDPFGVGLAHIVNYNTTHPLTT